MFLKLSSLHPHMAPQQIVQILNVLCMNVSSFSTLDNFLLTLLIQNMIYININSWIGMQLLIQSIVSVLHLEPDSFGKRSSGTVE